MFGRLLSAGIVRQTLLKLGGAWLGAEIRAIAEGKRGPGPQRLYLALQGRKTWTGVALGGAAAVLAYLGQAQLAAGVGTLAGLLVSVGLADKAWRTAPLSWENDGWFRFLRAHWADVIAVAGALTAALTTCDGNAAAIVARLGISCATGIAIVSGALAFVGWLVGESVLARPPRVEVPLVEGPPTADGWRTYRPDQSHGSEK